MAGGEGTKAVGAVACGDGGRFGRVQSAVAIDVQIDGSPGQAALILVWMPVRVGVVVDHTGNRGAGIRNRCRRCNRGWHHLDVGGGAGEVQVQRAVVKDREIAAGLQEIHVDGCFRGNVQCIGAPLTRFTVVMPLPAAFNRTVPVPGLTVAVP